MVKAVIFDCLGVLYVEFDGRLHLNQPLVDFIKDLRQDYKVGVLSNMSAETMSKLFSQEQQKEYFDEVVVSGEVNMLKPHAEIYELMAERLNVKPSECVMVDDTDTNCNGALEAGYSEAIEFEHNQALQTSLGKALRG